MLSREGFRLAITLADLHRPRMWVEEDAEAADGEAQFRFAALLSFSPEFAAVAIERPEVTVLLDCSNSMRADKAFQAAKAIARLTVLRLAESGKSAVNVVCFGSRKSGPGPFVT